MRGSALRAGAAALLGALLYLDSVPNQFVFDDRTLVAGNEQIRSLRNLPQIFRTPYQRYYRDDARDVGHYRPVTIASFAADHALGGLDPRGYHVVNVLLHAMVSGLVVLVGLAVGLTAAAALVGGLLFAAHPVHTEAVANLAGRAELLAAAFFLVALLAYRRVPRSGVSWGVTVVALLLALLSKENAVTFLGVAVAWELLLGRSSPRADPWRVSALLVPLLAYLGLRSWALGSPLPHVAGVDFLDNPLVREGLLVRWATATAIAARYLGLLLLPVRLSPDYSWAQIVPVASAGDPAFWLGLVATAALAVCLAFAVRRAPYAAFLVLFALLTFAVVSNFPVPIATIMAERLIYLPSVGVCLLAGWGFTLLAARFRRSALALLAVALVAASARTMARNLDWHDAYALFSKAAETSPRSARVLNNLAAELLKRNEPERARELLERARTIAPEWTQVRINLVQAHLAQHDLARAEAEARETARLLPREALAWFKLAEVLEGAGKPGEEVEALRQGLALEPRDAQARLALGTVLGEMRSYAAAQRELEAVVAEEPGSVQARTALGLVYLAMGRADRAVDELRHSVELTPGSPFTRNNLGNALRDAGRLDESIRELERAVEIDEHFAPSYFNLGLTLEKSGRLDEARARYQRALEIQPAHNGSLRAMGRLALRAGDPEAALPYLDRTLERDETSPESHALRARAYLDLKRYDEAERDYRRLLELSPESAIGKAGLEAVRLARR